MLSRGKGARRFRLASAMVVSAVAMLGCGASVAAAAATPGWAVKTFAAPTNFAVADYSFCQAGEFCDAYAVTAANVGTGTASEVVVRDRLPSGVEVAGLNFPEVRVPTEKNGNELSECGEAGGSFTCKYIGEIPPGTVISFRLEVRVTSGAPEVLTNRVEAEGSGAPPAVAASTNTANGFTPGFGLQDFGEAALLPEGTSDVQAGGHPAGNTTSLNWTTALDEHQGGSEEDAVMAVQEPKTQIVDLPSGFVGDAQALEKCPLSAVTETEQIPDRTKCPPDSLLGYVAVEDDGGKIAKLLPLYNVVPEVGYPAEFAFELIGATVTLLPRLLPSEQGYVLSVSVPYLPRTQQQIHITGALVTLFGDPSEQNKSGSGEAFFTNPADCSSAPLRARVEMDSWVEPANWKGLESTMFEADSGHAVSGCGALHFAPSVVVAPETTESDSPSGYEVDVRVPQAANIPGDVATPDLKDAVVSLPEGVSVDPSAANGLVACQESGPEGIELGARDRLASENRVEEGEERGADGLVHAAAGHCPAASTIGEVEVVTPLLAGPLHGHVFVAAPQCGGVGQPVCTSHSAEDGELFAVYLEVAGAGLVVKLKGAASVNPQTGRVTTRFTEIPQFPVSEVKLKLNGGPSASLANPQSCGVVSAVSDLTPWSAPYTPDATGGSLPFAVTGCVANAFSPVFSAGTTATGAGAYAPFTVTFSRKDGEQDLAGVSVVMPQGLLAKVAGVGRCGEAEVRAAEANTGGCPVSSRIGTAAAAAGAGADPFYQSGSVYLTGPYNGGAFGLAVVVAANAGPFHLGNIVTRASLRINAATGVASVVTDPLPEMIDGVPLRIKTVNAVVGNEGAFTFNPTSCGQQAVSGTITSVQGVSAGVSSPFAAGGCAGLPFKPVFTASTRGGASKAQGASMTARLVFPAAPAGSAGPGLDANIASFKVELPKQLPARNTTLQKACLAATFAADPASCPVGSDVGTVTVKTPLLAGALAGPVYLVSYGGEKFPQMVMVLQGEGVTLDVTGSVFVSKAGITSFTLKTVPDAPFTSFELKTPKGPYSILTSFVPAKDEFVLCGQKLVMPTTMTAQNGAVIKQNTKIAITGCVNAKHPKPRKSRSSKKGKK